MTAEVMDETFWDSKYPKEVSRTINVTAYNNLLEVFEKAVKRFADKPAFSNMGQVLTYGQLHEHSGSFASYIQNHTNLKPGDRIAIQLPNLLQYPIVLFGALRAGLVVVNTNPLYTTREMKHQFIDSGAKALVVLENFGKNVAEVLPETAIETLIIAQIGDMLPFGKRHLTNAVVKYVKKMVPDYNLPNAVSFRDVLHKGRGLALKKIPTAKPDDLAVLQYTGGTTGVAKGAMLTHANLVANMMQTNALLQHFKPGEETIIAPLPLYHIFCFTVSCMAILEMGCHSILITNPRDIPGFIKTLKNNKFSAFAGLNTLFVALMNHPDFESIDWSGLKLTISGGMALQSKVAKDWKAKTGGDICEGFGMTETSPVVCVNPPTAIQLGTIGMPVPYTLVQTVNEEGQTLPLGEAGELWVKGPQIMKGYWNRADATAETITPDGWLKTGDVAVIQADGYLKIVDRIKDMILVSGFNVYPNEIEDVICNHPQISECAAIGVACEKSGEVVKVFIVRKDQSLTEQAVKDFARKELTGYKVPKHVEFRDELPKTNVGKILRRQLRDEAPKNQKAQAS